MKVVKIRWPTNKMKHLFTMLLLGALLNKAAEHSAVTLAAEQSE